jgi:hypothetical protein
LLLATECRMGSATSTFSTGFVETHQICACKYPSKLLIISIDARAKYCEPI